MKKNMTFRLGMACVVALPLIGCGGSDGLGYTKNVPDEFNVVRRAPLIVPPEFNLLPPSSTSSRPTAPQGAELARLIVLPNAPLDISSKAEKSLVERAAGGKAYGDGIREELDNQTRGTVSENAELVEKLVADKSASD